ncbi:MAG: emp24/gp25L/p24 family protein [Candidatus Bathyarchaeota archaeon]
MRNTIGFVTFTLLLLVLLVPIAYAEVEALNVEAGDEQVLTLNLNAGMNVGGSISVTGGSGNDIDFWVTDTAGNKILDFGRVSHGTQFEFSATEDGSYSLHFDNSFSILSTKNIVLTYEITISGLNFTQLLLLTILVGAIIVVGIVAILKKGKNK